VLVRYAAAERAFDAAQTGGNADDDEVRSLDYESRSLVPAAAHALRGLLLLLGAATAGATDSGAATATSTATATAMSSAFFAAHGKAWVYGACVALVTSSSRSVRHLVQQLLAGPIQRLCLP